MCIVLPPAPPPVSPPPAPPLPGPPAPAPSPIPGVPQMVWDMANSAILAPGDNAILLPQILLQNGRRVESNSANLLIYVQNTGTTPGSLTFNVTADNGSLTITPAQQTIPAAGGGWSYTNFILATNILGTYNLTITNNAGGTVTFPIVFDTPAAP